MFLMSRCYIAVVYEQKLQQKSVSDRSGTKNLRNKSDFDNSTVIHLKKECIHLFRKKKVEINKSFAVNI